MAIGPYIPPSVLEDTEFPSVEPCGLDLQTTLDLLKEKWNLHYPTIDYFSLLNTQTEGTPEGDFHTGAENQTQVDDLWGEDIPETLTADWVQPHSDTIESLEHDATKSGVHAAAVQFPMAISLEPTERQLLKLGIDKKKAIIATVPTAVLDEINVRIEIGDFFIWRGEEFEVLSIHDRGYWYNTNIFLYVAMDVNRRRIGS